MTRPDTTEPRCGECGRGVAPTAQMWHDRAEQAEATVRRVRQMAHAWRDQLPRAIDRDTVAEQLFHATEQHAHLDEP